MAIDPKDESSSGKGVFDDLRTWVEKRLELFVLTLTERVTFIMADALQRIIGLLLLAGGVMFVWFAFSFLISEWVGSQPLGFFLAALPLLIAGLIFVMLQPVMITRRIQAGMLRQFLEAFENVLNDDRKADGEEQRQQTENSSGSSDRESRSASG